MKSKQMKWWEIGAALLLAFLLFSVMQPAKAQQKADMKFAARTSFCWAGGSGGGQGVFCNTEPVIVQVPGPVRVVETKVPVPGPTIIQRVEVPMPVTPAKQRE